MTKEELELLLKAFQLMQDKGLDERKALATIKAAVKEDYITLVMSELAHKK